MRTASNDKKRQNRPLILIAGLLCLIGICIGIVLIAKTHARNTAMERFAALSAEQTTDGADAALDEAADAAGVEGVEADASDDTEATRYQTDAVLPEDVVLPEKAINWSELYATNEDIYSWIYIPETNVDYPILQDTEVLDYYLDHNLDHSSGYPGCIYTRFHNHMDFEDPNTVIYGHNMKDGSMFKSLHYYKDGEFFAKNPYMYIWTPDKLMVYQIFAAYDFSDVDLLSSIDFDDPDIFAKYLRDVMALRDLNVHLRKDTFVPLDASSRIVTLSTCVSGADEVRYLVQAVRIAVIDKVEEE